MISDYLQTLDTDDVVIMDVFGLSKKFAHVIEELKTPLFDQFLNGLQENKFGNIQYWSESGHLITLHYSAHPVQRSANADKLTSIRSNLNTVKKKIINNLHENVANQSQTESIVEFASAFDLKHRCEKNAQVEYEKKLYSLYGKEYTHLVENDTCSDALPGYTIKITYPAKLKGTLSELLEEFDKIWHVLSKSWLKFQDTKPKSNITEVLDKNSGVFDWFPNIAALILILLSTLLEPPCLKEVIWNLQKHVMLQRSSLYFCWDPWDIIHSMHYPDKKWWQWIVL